MENLRVIILSIALAFVWVGCNDSSSADADLASESEGGESEGSESTDSGTESNGESSVPSSPVEGGEGTEAAEEGDETAEEIACLVDSDCPAATAACEVSFCNGESLTCEFQSLSEGSVCQVGSGQCTFEGICLEGECTGEDGATPGCNDLNECTNDSCEDGIGCVFQAIPGCCIGDEDCTSDSPCMLGSCSEEGECSFEEVEDCCKSNEECADDEPCTDDLCINGSCTNELKTNCCSANGDCADAGECMSGVCDPETNVCVYEPVEGCCGEDADCDNSNPCEVYFCGEEGICQLDASSLDPSCCNSDEACSSPDLDDNEPCTQNLCDPDTNKCIYEPIESCCKVGSGGNDCNDDNPCTGDFCTPTEEGSAVGSCFNEVINGCCYEDAEGVLSSCDDGNKCKLDTCNLDAGDFEDEKYEVGLCEYTNNNEDAECCDAELKCDDGNPCTFDNCDVATNSCTAELLPDCCVTAEDCGEPEGCQVFSCEENQCVSSPIDNCCATDSDCVAEGPCYPGQCVEGACAYAEAPIENCCEAPGGCDDGNVCTQDSCNIETFQCLFSPIPDCLECAEGECNDNNPCTDEVCNDSNLCDITNNGKCVSTEPICIMSNPGGASGTCNFQLVAEDANSIATQAEFTLAFDASVGIFEGQVFTVNCPNEFGVDTCGDQQKLPSGHDIVVTETSPGELLVQFTFPDANIPMSDAISTGDGNFTGDASFFKFTLGLPNNVEDNSLAIYVMKPAVFTVNGSELLDLFVENNTFVTASPE